MIKKVDFKESRLKTLVFHILKENTQQYSFDLLKNICEDFFRVKEIKR